MRAERLIGIDYLRFSLATQENSLRIVDFGFSNSCGRKMVSAMFQRKLNTELSKLALSC